MMILKIIGVIIFTLPLIFSIMTLPASIMQLAAPGEKGIVAKLTITCIILLLTYVISYIAGLIMLFSTGKLSSFAIPAGHILLTVAIYFISSYIEIVNAAHFEKINTTVNIVLKETYDSKIEVVEGYCIKNNGKYKCRLYDIQDQNYFEIQFKTPNKDNINELIKGERGKKNYYVDVNTKLVKSISGYVDDYVIVESGGNIVQLYTYIDLDYLYNSNVKHIENTIKLYEKVLSQSYPVEVMCYINLQVKPKYAKAGFVDYDRIGTDESLDKRTSLLMDSANFLLIQTGKAMTDNYFANRYGVVLMVIKGFIHSFDTEKLDITITNGFLDYIDDKLVLRGEYLNNAKQITGKYIFHFIGGIIIIEN